LTEFLPEHDVTSLKKEDDFIMQVAYKKIPTLLRKKGCKPLNTRDSSFYFFSLLV